MIRVVDIVNNYLERVKRIEQQKIFAVYLLKEGHKGQINKVTKELKEDEDKLEEFLRKDVCVASAEIEKEWKENDL
jgi:hypothetical protein